MRDHGDADNCAGTDHARRGRVRYESIFACSNRRKSSPHPAHRTSWP